MRYSRYVVLMKRLLSLGAFLIIAAVLAFFFVQRMPRQLQMSYERLGHIENDLTMVKPRLAGADTKGNPFVITADSAIQDAHNPKKASLKNLDKYLSQELGLAVELVDPLRNVGVGASTIDKTRLEKARSMLGVAVGLGIRMFD